MSSNFGPSIGRLRNRATILLEQGDVNGAQKLIARCQNHKDFHIEDWFTNAASGGRLKVVKYLTSHGVGVNTRDSHNRTALEAAALQGKANVVQFLLENGATIVPVSFGPQVSKPLIDMLLQRQKFLSKQLVDISKTIEIISKNES